MTDIKALSCKIGESGMTKTAIAKKSNMLRETLYARLNGITEFKASEIENISKVLGLTAEERDSIFFA